MRLPKPRSVQRLSSGNTGQEKRKRFKGLFRTVLIAMVIILAIGLFFYRRHHRTEYKVTEAASSEINSLKSSKDITDRKSLSSAYLMAGEYDKAEQNARQIADASNKVNDYLTLLNICTVRNVSDKQNCIDYAVSKIKPHVNDLSFFLAYTAAVELDQSNNKKDSVVFYQRAYDTYDPARADENVKTKDQIKQRIEELNG
jgi:hypothetical protein